MNGAIVAAALLRFLDPCTSVYQTDDPSEGARLASEPGYWPVPNGLWNPLDNQSAPRTIHAVFRKGDAPLEGYDPSAPSPLFKVNQAGYAPDMPKFAYAGLWMGPKFGPWRPAKPMESWRIADAATGETAFECATGPVLRVKDALSKEGVPFTGEETYEMDFSALRKEGEYYAEIPGVGRSETFKISSAAFEEAFRVHMGGLYQKRCGIAKTEPWTHWTAGACHREAVRGMFASDEGRLSPKVKWFDIIRDSTDWDRGERIHLAGGWHDAADYDRRPMHLNIVNDLCAVYLMRPGNFSDGQLRVPESANSIPDILDEAEWGLRHLLAVQQRDGGVGTWIESTGHPGPGNDAARDGMRYAVARATRASSLSYAAHAALLSRCHPFFREKYLDSARRAWRFAVETRPRMEVFEVKSRKYKVFTKSDAVYWDEDKELPASMLLKAAIDLYALTGDEEFAVAVRARGPAFAETLAKNAWNDIPLMFCGERALGVPEVFEKALASWEKPKLNAAAGALSQMERSYAYRVPWWGPGEGWVHAMGLGHAHPLVRAQLFVFAHAKTGERKYLEAASLANDFHCGCNPQGASLTSGLGRNYPVAFLDLPSYVDGVAEYTPGITPYRWTYRIPQRAIDDLWGGDRAKAAAWPIWRRWGNLETKTPGASEFTIWETIAPAASVTGYLLKPSGAPPGEMRRPADDIRDLPGYWPLP